MNISRSLFWRFMGGLLLANLMSGCGLGDSLPTKAELYVIAPTSTPELVTLFEPQAVTWTAIPAMSPTSTAVVEAIVEKPTSRPSMTPLSVAVPTRTPRSTPTLTATASATNSFQASGVFVAPGPDFPSDVNPLTGLQVADPALLERCPLAIKVSNAPAVVRPQAGLSQADLVFEHYAEGGVTRLTAIFLGQSPSMVGSVRSGRLIDLEIPAMFKALFAYSGTSAGVGELLKESDLWPDQIANPWNTASSAFYRRDLDRPYEHTLFVNPLTLWSVAQQRGISERQDLRGLTFDPNPLAGGSPASDARILYQSGISQVEWAYNASAGRYYRWQGGATHGDELTGEQLSAANVIVVGANHVETKILEDTWGGGHYSIEVQVWGEGPVSIFRDGQRYDGTWKRWERDDVISFWTKDGSQRLPLKPGNSWLQMVPLGFTGLVVAP
jgi:hypothetical protein